MVPCCVVCLIIFMKVIAGEAQHLLDMLRDRIEDGDGGFSAGRATGLGREKI